MSEKAKVFVGPARYSDRDAERPFRVIVDRGDLVLLGSRVVKRMRRQCGVVVSFVERGAALQFSVPEGAIEPWQDCVAIVARSLRVAVIFRGQEVRLRTDLPLDQQG